MPLKMDVISCLNHVMFFYISYKQSSTEWIFLEATFKSIGDSKCMFTKPVQECLNQVHFSFLSEEIFV